MTETDTAVSERPEWPGLPLEAWRDTYATLHMWAQIVGKIRLQFSPMLNHWWQATLYVTPRGLTTGAMPCRSLAFRIDFDFLGHQLVVETSDGRTASIPLVARSVADFYRETMGALHSLGIDARIWTMPQEVEDPIRFEQDETHRSYDAGQAQSMWRILVQSERVLSDFRSEFIGKCSPVHFFWGSFDLAVTRFSGRAAPPHPGGIPHLADHVVREAYSHEVSSLGFWPGGGLIPEAAFYSYAYPEPEGFSQYDLDIEGAYYHPEMREFILPYERVRSARDPDAMLMDFARRTFDAAADLGRWDRIALERDRSQASRQTDSSRAG